MALAALVLSGLVGVSVATVTPATADTMTACHSGTSQPRTYTHGSPITGLVDRHGYYYLDVMPAAACPVDAKGNIHLVAEVHVLAQVTKIGKLPGFFPPIGPMAMYWLEFHSYSSRGPNLTLENDRAYVTTPSERVMCAPDNSPVSCLCADGDDVRLTPVTLPYTVVLRYDGPWSAFSRYGPDARVRIAQETAGEILTDAATLDVVRSASTPPPPAPTK